MKRVPIDELLAALRMAGPAGATSRQLSEKLGMSANLVSARLSKQYNYGKIDRERSPRTGRYAEYTWKAPQC